jgi:asparagine synthase (glutamine-hydrolysing)
MKLGRFTTKRILREAVSTLLPREILTRPKMGFPVPFGGWVAGDWAPLAREVLLDRRARERGITDASAVERLLAGHERGLHRRGDAIWALLNLELWYRTFIDGEGVQVLPLPRAVDATAASQPAAAIA